jgi:hypothetical protein
VAEASEDQERQQGEALIRRCDMLWDELQETGYKTSSKVFTPRQVRAIYEWLGAP